jgi:tetratricopeptide (TPR) repeat protein
VQAASVGDIHFHDQPTYPIPSQLPPSPSFFTSRDRELAELQTWLAETTRQPLLAVISGPGGVGKTTLAVRWLHDVREHFPDGQLYVDLGALSSAGPATPEEVLEWFLVALGLPAERIPQGLPQRQALYRSLTADRVVAVLLDNALSAAQVRPLLPASARSTVVVTSRWRLAGLRMGGARFIEVNPMDIDDSVELLDRVVGDDRLARERPHAEELARLCGGMPIALSVIGARLQAHPNRPLAREVGGLRGQDRLATLSFGEEPSVEAVFDLSYRELPDREARTYRRCALHPGDSFGVEVVAAASGETVGVAELPLDALVERNLLAEIGDRRFRYHDLLLVHARQQADRVDPQSVRDATVRAMVEWYLDLCVVADLVLRPTRRRVGPRFDPEWHRPASFDDHGQAMGWLEAERGNVLRAAKTAADNGWDDLAWQFCEAQWGFYLNARHYDDWLALHHIGIPAAQRDGHRVAEARLRTQLGSALVNLRRFDEARQENLLALALAEQDDDQFTVAAVLSELAGVAQGEGDLHGALDCLTRAKSIREVIGTPRAVALCLRRTGEVLAELDRFEEAVATLGSAAAEMQRLGDSAQQARALTSLGSTYLRWGRQDEAEAPLTTALSLTHQLGSPHYRAEVLSSLAELAMRTGNPEVAVSRWSEAHRIYSDSGDPKAAVIAERLENVTSAARSED